MSDLMNRLFSCGPGSSPKSGGGEDAPAAGPNDELRRREQQLRDTAKAQIGREASPEEQAVILQMEMQKELAAAAAEKTAAAVALATAAHAAATVLAQDQAHAAQAAWAQARAAKNEDESSA